jgi:two-component system response regulator NreC
MAVTDQSVIRSDLIGTPATHSPKRCRVAIVDDDALFRDIAKHVCSKELRYEVVGEAGDARSGIGVIERFIPDIMLLDLSLDKSDGFEVIEHARATARATKFVLISAYCDEYTIYRIEQAQATGALVHGFIDKTTSSVSHLSLGLTAVTRGERYFTDSFLSGRLRRAANGSAFTKLLSEWEQTLLSLMALGMTDDAIARHVRIAPRTVQTHRSNILRKMHMSSTVELLTFAISNSLARFPRRTWPRA